MPLDIERIRADRKHKVAMMINYFSIIMAIFYLVMAGIVMFTKLFEGVEQNIRYLFGIMLFLYGAFRFYRVFSRK